LHRGYQSNQIIMKRHTITIGIPALNEEKNIANLLRDVLRQQTDKCVIGKIIVSSDGSKDRTVEIAKKFSSNKLVVIDNARRLGKAARQNQIIYATKSDILVLLDADTQIKDINFIEKLVAPIINKESDMTSPAIQEMKIKGLTEEILDVSMQLKTILFSAFKDGNNVFNCHGPARAISKKIYKEMHFSESDGEDMFSYLSCVSYGGKFKYVKRAVIEYKLPHSLGDHGKQSFRYLEALKLNSHSFNRELVNKEMKIPISVYLKASPELLKIGFKYPLHIFAYVAIFLVINILKTVVPAGRNTWQIASTKSLLA